MKRLPTLLLPLLFATCALAQSDPVVPVSHAAAAPASPGRVVIDLSSPQAVEQFLAAIRPAPAQRVTIDVSNPLTAAQFLAAIQSREPLASGGAERVVVDVGGGFVPGGEPESYPLSTAVADSAAPNDQTPQPADNLYGQR